MDKRRGGKNEKGKEKAKERGKRKRRKEKRTKKKEHTHNPSSPVHEQHASLCDFFSIINRSRKKKKR